MTDPPTVYSAGEIAAILGVHRNTVWRWLATGKLPGRKVGGLWMVPETAFETWLGSRRTTKNHQYPLLATPPVAIA